MTTLVCWVLLMCGNNTIASDRWASLVDPAFHHITPEQGLPNGFSTALAQDKIGFLWIATPNGLARWDGYRIRIYKPQINDPRSLPDINIQSLHVDTHGRLWVGSSAGGLARYEPEHDHFTRFPVGPDGLSNITINTITSDDEDGIWVGTDDGLNHINHTTSKISQFNHGNSKSNILKNRRIRAILRARDGGLWLGTQTGLLYRPSGGVQFKEVPSPKQNSIAITQLYQATDGRIWVGTAAHGAYWYDARHQNLQPLATDASNQGNDWILSIIEPRPGETWFGTFGHGILIHQSQTNQLRRMRHDPSRRTGLSDDTIFAMLQDQSGLLWISSTRTVSRHDVSNHAVLSVFGLQSNNKLSDPNVRSVLSLPEGNIWLGLHSNGADIIHPDHGLIRSLRPDPLRPESALQKNRIWALLATGPDTIFLGTDRGLYRAKADGSALQRVQVAGRAADATVRALLRHGNKLFLGTNDGLWQYALSGNQPVAPFRPEGAEQISDPRITSMLQGPDGSIWIGTRNGLNQYDPISHQVRKFMPNADNPKDLAPGLIASLLFDRRSHLWVATLGGGINVLEREGKQAQFRRISTSQGLPNDSVNCLVADGIGNIWASTDNGIARIEPEQLTIRTIQPADGAVHNNYWSSACDITSQGELVFGANGGLTIIRPNLLRKWTYRPPLVITDIKVGGQALPASRFNQAGETNKSVQIPSNANSLQVEFSALDFSAPDQNRYAYRLEGFDTDWIESDHTRRLAAWTNLAPGNYRLRLRGSNRDGEWAEQEVSVAVEVLAAWYQTWWWRSLILLVGLILIMTLVHLRTRYLYRKRVHLENEVRQRTLELEKNQHNLVRANQDLNRANGELAQSAETLRELGRIGRDITANLDLHVTFDTLYQHVVHLINAQCVIIYRHNRETGQLELAFGREHGKVMEMHVIGLDSPHSNTARTARERQEIMLDAKNALPESGLLRRKLRSALYVPLVVDHRLLGVMVVQSGLEYAYNERERLIFRNLCAYGAIALDNANAYRQLQETQARLVEQEKLAALGSMVAGVAHELNTPIGNSLLMLTALEDKKQLFEDKVARGQLRRSDLLDFLNDSNEASSVIMRGLTNAAELVASFKQVAVDRTAAHQRIFNLAHTTHEIIATLMNQVRIGGHHIEIDMADEISLNSYPGPYGQVITNLINNALLHAFDEGQQGIMHLSARQEVPERILIEFRDNGKGIDPKHIKRIFEPFFTTKMGQGGSGLGLSISYNIVSSLLNGTIRVESTPGQGTCFTLDLPLLAPAR